MSRVKLQEVKFLDSPFGWAKQKWGNLTPGQQKTGIIGASSFLPFPLNVAAAATQFLSKGEGYAVGGLDAYEKGIYNTIAGKRMLYKDPGTGLLKDIRGKNVYSLAGDYEEGLEDEYNEDLSLEEAKIVALRAVKAAITRNIGTGDGINVALID